uniref:40S ribosomal protein S21 n=1 Tax=Steinernema glaseri TaxID=37863 RepID=A0A1I8AC34_9BILA
MVYVKTNGNEPSIHGLGYCTTVPMRRIDARSTGFCASCFLLLIDSRKVNSPHDKTVVVSLCGSVDRPFTALARELLKKCSGWSQSKSRVEVEHGTGVEHGSQLT